MKTFIINSVILITLSILSGIPVQARAQTVPPPLAIEVLSSTTLNGTAGDYVTVKAQITNTGENPLNDVTTYLSLMDMDNKMPVDLEDWSVEKGLYIETIESQQTLPLEWKIHFIKAGTYALVIIAETPSSAVPQVSTLTQFKVNPKRNLNPGQVLPVALGTPIVLIFILLILSYKRRVIY